MSRVIRQISQASVRYPVTFLYLMAVLIIIAVVVRANP